MNLYKIPCFSGDAYVIVSNDFPEYTTEFYRNKIVGAVSGIGLEPQVMDLYVDDELEDSYDHSLMIRGKSKVFECKSRYQDQTYSAPYVCNDTTRIVVTNAEQTEHWTMNEVLEHAKGNKKYAKLLIDRLPLYHYSIYTMIDEDIRLGEIEEEDDKYLLVNPV